MIARLREGDLGDTPLSRLRERGNEQSLFRASTRATLEALRTEPATLVKKMTTGGETAEIWSVPNAMGGEPAKLLAVYADDSLLDIAGAHDIASRHPGDFDFSGNAALRA